MDIFTASVLGYLLIDSNLALMMFACKPNELRKAWGTNDVKRLLSQLTNYVSTTRRSDINTATHKGCSIMLRICRYLARNNCTYSAYIDAWQSTYVVSENLIHHQYPRTLSQSALLTEFLPQCGLQPDHPARQYVQQQAIFPLSVQILAASPLIQCERL